MKIVLIGMPGCGKTTTAKRIAENTKLDFIDTDNFIEETYKISINQIFLTQGERKFREYEHDALTEILKKDHIIISAGGGLPCFSDNMKLIKESAKSVYLSLSPELLLNRIKQTEYQAVRPLIRNKTESEILTYIIKTLEVRKKYYETADYQIDASKSTEEILMNFPFDL